MSLVTPKLYPIVDLDGLDLAEIEGQQVPGIYNKIRDNLDEDKIEIFYHWYFADIMLTPYRVVIDDSVVGQYTINNAILVKSDDTISIIGHTYIPVIESLSVNENGTYNVPIGVDGYAPVVVDVPSIPPVLVQLNVTENGTYTPATGVDGFSQVEVNVPIPTPVTVPLSVTENGTYTPSQGVDGFSSVAVNVPSGPNLLVDVLHFDLHNGYVYSGNWIYGTSIDYLVDIYQVQRGHVYVCALGSTPGNRFRAAFFSLDPATLTGDWSGTGIGTDVSNPAAHSAKEGFLAPYDGYIAIMKTNMGVTNLKSYLIDINKLD